MTIKRLEPPPSHVGDFEYRWRTWLENLWEALQDELKPGWFLSGGAAIDVDDSPYQMLVTDAIILASPDVGTGSPANIRVDLVAGENLRLIDVKNDQQTGSNNVQVYPNGSDLIEPSVGGVPGSGPANISKGNSITWVFVEEDSTWWII